MKEFEKWWRNNSGGYCPGCKPNAKEAWKRALEWAIMTPKHVDTDTKIAKLIAKELND